MSPKPTQSLKNRIVENEGIRLLLSLDHRFQLPDNLTKRALLGALAPEGSWGTRSFDLVYTATPLPPLNAHTVLEAPLEELALVEMKSTRGAIRDQRLGNFFFGATEREYDLAEHLGEQFKFAFVVLNSKNSYGCPFAVLLTLEELRSMTRTQRVQFQVNLLSQAAWDLETTRRPAGILLR